LYNNGTGTSNITQAAKNTAIGSISLYANTTGYDNTSIGYNTSISNTTGTRNTSIGSSAFKDNTSGNYNTAIGTWALANNTTAGNNTAIGYSSLVYNTTGSVNTAMGVQSGRYNSTGNFNVSLGGSAMEYNTIGSNNTVIGKSAGQGSFGNGTFNGCVLIGYESGKNNTSDNKLFIDNSLTATPLIGGDFDANRVDINGTIKITGGSAAGGKVLTTDADGLATWETPTVYASAINE